MLLVKDHTALEVLDLDDDDGKRRDDEGIDFVYFGAYDLSQDLGVPGQVRDNRVTEAIASGVATVNAAGKCPGGFVAESTEDIAWQLSMGIRLITFGVDSGLLNRVVEETVSWFRGSTKNSQSVHRHEP